MYEAASPEKPSPVIAASMEKKPAKKEKKGKKIIGNGDNKDDVPVLRRSRRHVSLYISLKFQPVKLYLLLVKEKCWKKIMKHLLIATDFLLQRRSSKK